MKPGTYDGTQQEMVLEAVRRLSPALRRGVRRPEIQEFIKNAYGKSVPPQNISTYLRRLKQASLIEVYNNHWWPKR